MPIQTLIIKAFKCDKCEHKWVSKKKEWLNKEVSSQDLNKNEVKKQINFPKICPKCKSKNWNYLNKQSEEISLQDIKLIKEGYGSKIADSLRCGLDNSFHKKKVQEEIAQIKKKIEEYTKRKQDIEEILSSRNIYLKELEKELKEIE